MLIIDKQTFYNGTLVLNCLKTCRIWYSTYLDAKMLPSTFCLVLNTLQLEKVDSWGKWTGKERSPQKEEGDHVAEEASHGGKVANIGKGTDRKSFPVKTKGLG